MNMYADARRAFLVHAPDDLRSWITNVVLREVRAGAHLPEAVIDAALRTLRARLGHWGKEDSQVRAMLSLLLRHQAEALRFAEWCLAWEALPLEEKARQKAARGEEHRQAHLEQVPATEKQVRFVRLLGYAGEVRSKRHASELIDQLKRARAS